MLAKRNENESVIGSRHHYIHAARAPIKPFAKLTFDGYG